MEALERRRRRGSIFTALGHSVAKLCMLLFSFSSGSADFFCFLLELRCWSPDFGRSRAIGWSTTWATANKRTKKERRCAAVATDPQIFLCLGKVDCLAISFSLMLVIRGSLFFSFSSHASSRIVDCDCLLTRNREKGPPAQHHASRVRVCVCVVGTLQRRRRPACRNCSFMRATVCLDH